MLIFATTSVLSQRDGFQQPYNNLSNRPHPLAQNRSTILLDIAVWRVVENLKSQFSSGDGPKHPSENAAEGRSESDPPEQLFGKSQSPP